ncbi:MAG: HEAT repeat domain-containing protein [Cyanobacteria bacterium P01_G01_bin.39]
MDRDRLKQIYLKQIKQKLRHQGIYQRKLALDELATTDSDLAIPVLTELLQDKDFALRKIAVMGLGNHPTEESFQMLKKTLETEPDPNVLAEAANSLFEFGDCSIEPLQQLFTNSDNWLVRQTVISILVDSNQPDVLLQVANLAIADPDQTTKETGILALHRLLETNLKQQALDLFAILSSDNYWRTRWRTAIALNGSPDPQAKKLLSKLQKDTHYRVVAASLPKAS